ncbi:MAG: ABC transporter substrate-binding protein, partial [Candidatus Methylomirabilales bacterium]
LGAGPFQREVVDEVGRRIKVPERVHRIVSLAPSLTEIVFALGLENELVGVTDFCDFPPQAKRKAKVGGMINPSLEAILALRPDLVLATVEGNRAETVLSLERLGLPVFVVKSRGLNGLFSSIQKLGLVTGKDEAAQALVQRLQEKVKEVVRRVESLSRPRVLYLIWPEPPIVPGKGTLIDDLVQLAGGESISGDSPIPYPQYSLEEIVARAPEVIVIASKHGERDASDLVRRLKRLDSIPAVRHGRIHFFDGDLVNRPGPRIVEGLLQLARLIHPEAFP